MPGRSVIIQNSKVMSQFRNYLSKFVNEKTENALNQELNYIIQKLQPILSGYLWKNAESAETKSDSNSIPTDVTTPVKDSVKETKKIVPKWKENGTNVSKESIAANTHHILTLLTNAISNQSILKRVEDLNTHLNRYPYAKHIAEKANAVRLLLRLKQKADEEMKGPINEALALLGYAHPVKGRGIRVLSIDGGGIRGILVLEMLKKLEELTGKKITDMFDLICGVSTGAIIASLLGAKNHTLDEISEIYRDLSIQVFTQSALKGTSNLVWSHSYYNTALWEKLLRENIGEGPLITTSRDEGCPKLCILSAVINQSSLSAYVFRNYALSPHVHSRYEGSHRHQLWEAVRASAAAPTYFEEFKLGSRLHQDGGILFNNPTAVAIHEARLLWPSAPIQCVMSFGTGRTIPLPVDAGDVDTTATASTSSWKSKFYAVIESATDTEGVHMMLSDLLPERLYYRFNPYLTEMLNMAETDGKKLEQLKRDAVMYLRRNEDKFQEAAKGLGVEKGPGQKILDWVDFQKEIFGLKFVR